MAEWQALQKSGGCNTFLLASQKGAGERASDRDSVHRGDAVTEESTRRTREGFAVYRAQSAHVGPGDEPSVRGTAWMTNRGLPRPGAWRLGLRGGRAFPREEGGRVGRAPAPSPPTGRALPRGALEVSPVLTSAIPHVGIWGLADPEGPATQGEPTAADGRRSSLCRLPEHGRGSAPVS